MTQPLSITASPDVFRRLALALGALTGWRRLLIAAGCGALTSAALPPLYLVPLLWPAFSGLIWLLDGATKRRQAFAIGWAFGFGHFLTGLYWVAIAFFVDAERFGALAPVAVLALAAGLALFPGLAVLLVQLSGCRGSARILLLSAAWLLVEWLRSWLFGGFPWNLIGTVWAFSEGMIQLAALLGVWGLSWITVLAAAAPALLGEERRAPRLSLALALGLGLVLPAAAWGGGTLRLLAAPAAGSDSVPGVTLRLVQPSIEQSLKWQAELRQQHVARQMAMTVGPGYDRITHVIWAETAVPFNLAAEPDLRRALSQVVPADGALITGAPRAVDEGRERKLWNSLFAVDREGEIIAGYDKVNLVPFGEFMPLRDWLGWAKLTPGGTDFSSGPGRRTITLPGLPPFSPLICYEVIFPGRVTASGARPGWLLSVTNDAWFGLSSGPHQHLASARLRAVEEGLPMVRVANNGITAVIDGYGRMLQRFGLNEVGVIDTALPEALSPKPIFATIGNGSLIVVLAVTVVASFAARRYP
ncbi:MAG: apolipoprotein N-acyltransferase [Kiloniellales bacterium]